MDFARKVKMFTEFLVIPGQRICRKCELFLCGIMDEQRDMDEAVNDDMDNVSECSQASLISLNASDCAQKAPFQHKLQTVNSALQVLELTNLTEKDAKDPQKVSMKISEMADKIYHFLSLPTPRESVGEKVLEQFVNKFDNMISEDQYRVLIFMPRGTGRVELEKNIWCHTSQSQKIPRNSI